MSCYGISQPLAETGNAGRPYTRQARQLVHVGFGPHANLGVSAPINPGLNLALSALSRLRQAIAAMPPYRKA
jgi:hypothetical protein